MKKRIILVLVFLTLYCSGQAGKNKFIKVYFPDSFSATAELAVSDEERAQGLMFREKINEDQAMLFLFEKEDIHSFWMKNMRFAIDILWLDGRKRIVHIENQVPPCPKDPCSSYIPAAAASFVLELQAGFVEKHGLRLYDRIEFVLPRELSEPRNP
ncbi:MAG: hypothetical protein A2V45_03575 [Candidatus Aminicenantes bacterium RBG_19FT_COMBO_58_17]|jgi:hypothetical protein|nr:MAG: hypothetical protein A2V45_03575 [Candidatus Aminicenantes bacterium RBG_19FT_COMBO_58_17]HCS47283.1 hypothetical protein [Candidatus Aminicenantes bacterium]